MKKMIISMLLLLLLSVPAQGSAMRVKLLTLEQMVQSAEVVFVGRCLSSKAQEDPQLGKTVTVIEFDVVEALKGVLGETHRVKQYGGMLDGRSHRIAGMPTYVVGEDVILFLYGESEYGLSSPVGSSQGKFTFVRDEEPSLPPMIVNNINNNGLLAGLDMNSNDLAEPKKKAIRSLLRSKRGPIPYEDFLLITKALIDLDGATKE